MRRTRGQMTIELAVAMPVIIVVAVIAVNALTFIGQCAMFDRVAHDAVRIHATSPAYAQGADQSCALIERDIRNAIDAQNVEVSVERSGAQMGMDCFTATLEYHPTLFGMGLRSEVFGVAMPSLSHTTRYVVAVYKPGVIA